MIGICSERSFCLVLVTLWYRTGNGIGSDGRREDSDLINRRLIELRHDVAVGRSSALWTRPFRVTVLSPTPPPSGRGLAYEVSKSNPFLNLSTRRRPKLIDNVYLHQRVINCEKPSGWMCTIIITRPHSFRLHRISLITPSYRPTRSRSRLQIVSRSSAGL